MVEIIKGDHEVQLPDTLAALLIKHRGWKLGDGEELEVDEPAAPEPVIATSRASAKEEVVEEVVEDLNPEAACDDDLPEGIVFADSAYETVVNEETGEEIRVLKTHCRNGHEYAGNVKIRIRGDKAYRECQTCLSGRKARAAAKRAESRK